MLPTPIYQPPSVDAYPPSGNATSDAANLASAVNDLPSTGGEIRLRVGDYALNPSSPLTFDRPVLLKGQGKDDYTTAAPTRLLLNSATADALVLNVDGCAIRDLAIVNTSGTTPTAGAGIHAVHATGMLLDGVKISGFWNDLQIDNGYFYVLRGSYFLQAVNYGAYIRDLANGDQGDPAITACYFANTAGYTTSRAVRWESGGGPRFSSNKIVGNILVGIECAVTDGVNTSDILIENNSIEVNSGGAAVNICQNAGAFGTGTGTGTLKNIIVTGNQSLNGLFQFTAQNANCLSDILLSGNIGYAFPLAAYFKNIAGITVGKNRWDQLTATAIEIDTGCTDYTVEPQQDIGTNTNVALFVDNAVSGYGGHARTGHTGTYTREIPSTTSSVTYTNLWQVTFDIYSGGTLEITLSGQLTGVGGFAYNAKYAVAQQASNSNPALTLIGSATATANAPSVNVALSNQVATVQVRLPGSGTDIVTGKCTLSIDGQPTKILKC